MGSKVDSLPQDLKALAQALIDKKFPKPKPMAPDGMDYAAYGRDYFIREYSGDFSDSTKPAYQYMRVVECEFQGMYGVRHLRLSADRVPPFDSASAMRQYLENEGKRYFREPLRLVRYEVR